jgi:multiple sugar transport system permease protein
LCIFVLSQCFDSCHYCAPTAYTLPVALANLTGEHVPDTKLMMAGAVITILPVMLVFIALQKYYIGGIMAAGLKE